jgi:hypothetical protein
MILESPVFQVVTPHTHVSEHPPLVATRQPLANSRWLELLAKHHLVLAIVVVVSDACLLLEPKLCVEAAIEGNLWEARSLHKKQLSTPSRQFLLHLSHECSTMPLALVVWVDSYQQEVPCPSCKLLGGAVHDPDDWVCEGQSELALPDSRKALVMSSSISDGKRSVALTTPFSAGRSSARMGWMLVMSVEDGCEV